MSEVEGLRKTVTKLKTQLAKAQSERDKMRIPTDEAYRPLVLLQIQADGIAYPACEDHGAMLCVNPERTLYRCPECNVGVDVSSLNQYIQEKMAELLGENLE